MLIESKKKDFSSRLLTKSIKNVLKNQHFDTLIAAFRALFENDYDFGCLIA